MDELRQGTIRERHDASPAVALSYVAPRRSSAAVDIDHASKLNLPSKTADFLDSLYASAVEFARLPEALTRFSLAFDADETCFFTADPSANIEKVAIVERSVKKGAASSTLDSDATATGRVLAQELAVRLANDDGEIFLGTLGARHAPPSAHRGPAAQPDPIHYLAVALPGEGEPAIGVATLRTGHPFTDAERQRARALLPDMRRAFDLRRRAGRVEALGLGVQLFDRNPTAILITRQRSVERSNAAALALLADGRPISLSSGKLRFEDSRVHTAFELISRPDAQAQGNQAFAFVVEGVRGCTWIAQLSAIRPASHSTAAGMANPSAVVAALTPFSAASQTREAMLNGFTDLTPTERTIFAAFVDGQDIAAIAARLNRSVETVRWHVRNLFTKLGVNSQADLARLGALLLPI